MTSLSRSVAGGYGSMDPTGGGQVADVKTTAASAAPEGWLLCDGAAISRATYPTLFAAIGVVYGAGDGSTTFNIPNMKGRVPAGYDSTQTEFNVLGKTGGAKTHVLTDAEMPSHSHTVYPGDGERLIYAEGGYRGALYKTSENEQTSVAGNDQPHNNLQPYIALNYVIKY